MATRLSDALTLSPDDSLNPQPGHVAISRHGREQHFNDVTFICHLCNDTVKRATFLSCLHSFCKQCIDGRLQVETHSMDCPLCPSAEGQSVELQSNPLPELISKLKELKLAVRDGAKSLTCTDCVFGAKGKPAVAYCVECNATICHIDMKSHKKYNLGHLILELNQLQGSTVQEILKRLQTSKQMKSPSNQGVEENKDFDPEQEITNPLTSSSAEVEDECILEARSIISQLEERKGNIEKEWSKQISQIVEFFQELHTKLEARQTALLEELSQLYHPLMTPLQEAIGQLEQNVAYTGYLGVLSRYSRVAEISERPAEKIQDISVLLANFTTPSDPYLVDVKQQDQQTIQNSVNAYLTLNKDAKLRNPGEVTPKLFLSKISHELSQEITKYVTPLDVAFHSTTNTYYVLFDCYWKTYQQLHKSLVERETMEIKNPASMPINSSIALQADSVYIMANHNVYVYSFQGKYIFKENTLQIQNQFGAIFPNPKIYTFTDINFLYLASLQSAQVYIVDFAYFGNQGNFDLTSNCQNVPGYTGHVNFVDLVRSPVQNNQVLILYSMFQTQNPPLHNSTNNQYYIQVYDINNMQFYGIYSLSQPMSPFCCLTAHDNTLYVLDVSTGSAHIYNFNEMQTNSQQTDYYGYGGGYGGGGYCGSYYLWNQKSVSKNSVPKSTKLDGQAPKDEMIRACFNQHSKNQIILFSGGIINFIF